MTNNPFFSILIPTKNRSHIVNMAIESSLNQTFDDFEIILADNDDSDIATRGVVQQYTDPRIKYFRTGGNLSMPDNWEFALNQSSGRYVTVLEDKQVFYKDALEILNKVIAAKKIDVVTWAHDFVLSKPDGDKLSIHLGSERVEAVPSSQILSSFAQRPRLFEHLPRMLNSLVSRELIEKICSEKNNGRFFVPTTPDLSAAFTQLNFVDQIYYIDNPLSIWGGANLSNAKKLREKTPEGKRFIDDIGGQQYVYNYVPIKSMYLNKNLIINDYIRLTEEFGGKLAAYPISDLAYMIACRQDIVKGLESGTDMRDEQIMWQKHLKTLPLKTQFNIRTKLLKDLTITNGFRLIRQIFGEKKTSEIAGILKTSKSRAQEPLRATILDVTARISDVRSVDV